MRVTWEKTTLGSVCSIQSGAGFPEKHQGQAVGEYPFYKVSDMNLPGNERVLTVANNYISEGTRRELRASIFPAGSIVFPKVGGAIATNKKRRISQPCCVDNNIMGLIPKPDEVDESFLAFLLEGIDIYEFSNKSNPPSIRQGTVEGWPIELPPLAEQKRIVAILDEAFDGIATAKANAEKNLANARATFESYRESLFAEQREGWVQKPLSALCDVKHGFAFDGEYFRSEGTFVLLTPGNFYERGGYRDRGEKQKYYVGEIPHGYVLDEGDLLVAMTEQAAGLLGSPILVPEANKFLHNQRLGLVIKKPGAPWINEFFFHVFNLEAVRKAIHDSASGVKVRHTSPTKIGEVHVKFPTSLEEQKQIVGTLTSLIEEAQRLEVTYVRKLAALEELKQSLLREAFSGRL